MKMAKAWVYILHCADGLYYTGNTINLEKNQLIVVQGKDHPLLYRKSLTASNLHWVSGKAPAPPYQCKAKTRYRQPDQNCIIKRIETNESTSQCMVEFDTAQFAITPGQSVVFYAGEICLGGGVID